VKPATAGCANAYPFKVANRRILWPARKDPGGRVLFGDLRKSETGARLSTHFMVMLVTGREFSWAFVEFILAHFRKCTQHGRHRGLTCGQWPGVSTAMPYSLPRDRTSFIAAANAGSRRIARGSDNP
jgi:hypothetical protein